MATNEEMKRSMDFCESVKVQVREYVNGCATKEEADFVDRHMMAAVYDAMEIMRREHAQSP